MDGFQLFSGSSNSKKHDDTSGSAVSRNQSENQAKRKRQRTSKNEVEDVVEVDQSSAPKIEEDTTAADDISTFEELGIKEWLNDTCKEVGITHPTIIQRRCIAPALQGRDVIGSDKTGSGKTAAFALPIIQTLSEDMYGIYAVVITPTRELAFQIADQFNVFGTPLRARIEVVVGGIDFTKQALAVQKKPHIIVATPGRLSELIRQNVTFPKLFRRVKFLVLDEADRLLEEGFQQDLGDIMAVLPPPRCEEDDIDADMGTTTQMKKTTRQTLLFSATMTANMVRLRTLGLGYKPYVFDATPLQKTTVDTLRQEYLFIPAQMRMAYLVYLVMQVHSEEVDTPDEKWKGKGKKVKAKVEDVKPVKHIGKDALDSSIIIFTATRRNCQLLHLTFRELGITSTPLHSQESQAHRLASLARFRSGIVKILIATDVASRGLDIPEVALVINYDLPKSPTSYVHRVGRTARAGRGGRAVSLVSQYDVGLVHAIEESIGKQLVERTDVDESEVLTLMTRVGVGARVARLALEDSGFDDKEKQQKDRNKKKKRARQMEK